MRRALSSIPIILLFLSLFFGAFAVQQYFSYIGPVLAERERVKVEKEKLALERERLGLTHVVTEENLRREATTNLYSWFSVIVLVSGAGVVAFFIWQGYDRRKESWARPVDGMFALQNLVNRGKQWSVNHNKSITGMLSVDDTGEIKEAAINPEFGPDRMLAHAKVTQTTNTAVALANSPSGRYSSPWKAISGAYERVTNFSSPEEKDIEPFEMLTLKEAIEQSVGGRWIIGQSEIDGELSIVDLKAAIHVGLIGAPGVGKTSSTGLLIAFYAVRDGMQVVCLDAKGGEDWKQYDRFFDVQECDEESFPSQLGAVTKEYNRRLHLLNENKWVDYTQSNGEIKPMLIILEEFGELMDKMKQADSKMYDRIEVALTTLMRTSRACGIHFLIIDQTTIDWPKVVSNIIKMYIAYKLSSGAGNAVKLYYLNSLAEKGEFCTTTSENNKFKSWHTGTELDTKQIASREWKLLPDRAVKEKVGLRTDFGEAKEVEEVEVVKEVEPVKEYYTKATVTSDAIREAFATHGTLNKTAISLFGPGKTGKYYLDIIKKGLEDGREE